MKSVARSATVVCMEKTEFFVVDNESFFKFGFDAFSKEEIHYRHSCIKSIELFSAVDEFSRRQIAEECREITYLTDKIIEPDSRDCKFVYFVTKGECYVLRLLDLDEQRRGERKLRASDSYNGHHTMFSNYPILPSIPATISSSPVSSQGLYPGTSFATPHKPLKEDVQQTGLSKRKGLKRKKLVSTCSPFTNKNLVFFKVDRLTPGKSFGLQHIIEKAQEDEIKDTRKFIFVSSGCRIIRIPMKLIQDIAKDKFLKKMKSVVRPFPSDEELYEEFCCDNRWRCFKKDLVYGKDSWDKTLPFLKSGT